MPPVSPLLPHQLFVLPAQLHCAGFLQRTKALRCSTRTAGAALAFSLSHQKTKGSPFRSLHFCPSVCLLGTPGSALRSRLFLLLSHLADHHIHTNENKKQVISHHIYRMLKKKASLPNGKHKRCITCWSPLARSPHGSPQWVKQHTHDGPPPLYTSTQSSLKGHTGWGGTIMHQE